MKRIVTITAILLVSIAALLAEPVYDTGSQVFIISAGVDFPLAVTRMKDGSYVTGTGMGKDGTHISLGGYGSIDYEVFTSQYISMGGEIGYQFNYCLDGNLFTQVPMMYKISYVPVQGTFDIPLSLGVGLSYMSYNNASVMSPVVQATIGARFFPSDSWGFGIKGGIQTTFELYIKKDKNGMGTFLPLVFFASFRH